MKYYAWCHKCREEIIGEDLYDLDERIQEHELHDILNEDMNKYVGK